MCHSRHTALDLILPEARGCRLIHIAMFELEEGTVGKRCLPSELCYGNGHFHAPADFGQQPHVRQHAVSPVRALFHSARPSSCPRTHIPATGHAGHKIDASLGVCCKGRDCTSTKSFLSSQLSGSNKSTEPLKRRKKKALVSCDIISEKSDLIRKKFLFCTYYVCWPGGNCKAKLFNDLTVCFLITSAEIFFSDKIANILHFWTCVYLGRVYYWFLFLRNII